MTSLLDLLKARYLETLKSVSARWKIVVVDEFTHKMLNSVLSTYDVLDQGVQQVDLITNHRPPQRHLPAIYLLMPTTQNIELILRDHSPTPPPVTSSRSKKSKDSSPVVPVEGPKYASAHLHFVDGIDDKLMERVVKGLPQDYLAALTELYVNFHALEARTFTLESPRTFSVLYAPPERSARESIDRWEEEISWMSRSIVNALVTLGEYPLIRYYNPPSSFHAPLGPAITAGEHISKRLAERVQRDIDLHARNDTSFPPRPEFPRPRGVVFITDRSMDLYAPLLHEFTYQAMCNDLLDIEDGVKYKYSFRNSAGAVEDKEVLLTDDDQVWKDVRHMHMKDALDKLIADFRAYAGEHGGRFGAEGSTSLNDMKDMLASLPQLQKVKEKLSVHLTMAEKCMKLFETKKLPLSASVEQCCATGVTPEGNKPKTLVEEMVPLLDDRSVSSTDKLRIIGLYIMHRDGVPEGDKKRLYQHARLALHEMDAIDNMAHLGVNVSKDSGKKRKPLFKIREESDAYDISRFQPALKYMLEDHFSGKLDDSIFPYVRDAPPKSGKEQTAAPTASLRSMRADWASRGRRVVNEPRQRALVFVAGGATYSEVRSVYKVSESNNKDVFLGTTHIFTPEQFVRELGSLDRGGGGTSLAYEPANKKAPHIVAAPLTQVSFDRRYQSALPQPAPPPAPQQIAPPGQKLQAPRSAPQLIQQAQSQPYRQVQPPQTMRPQSQLSSVSANSSRPSSVPNGSNGDVEKKKKKKLFGF